MSAFQASYGVVNPGYFGMAYGYSAASGWPTMKQGATDAGTDGAVSVLANALKKASYDGKDSSGLSALKIDGKTMQFGIGLDRQVRNFQKAKGLDVDGVVGPATWKALGEKGTASYSSGGGGGGSTSVSTSAPPAPPAPTGIMDSEYFWPGVIVGTTLVGVGVYFTFFNK
jgi:peptidoglycan hydrolase-like protein with peptidoglycan-binding domain